MIIAIRTIIILLGLLYLAMGAGFLFDPSSAGADFGLNELGVKGLASIRADFTAFFVVAGGCLVWGAVMRKADPLIVSAALMGAALIGRAVNLLQNGTHEGWLQPMLFEAFTVLIALLGSRMLPQKPSV
jgi:hypothetical protein